MTKSVWLILGLILGIALLTGAGCVEREPTAGAAASERASTSYSVASTSWQAFSANQQAGIAVTGEGTIMVAPDLAIVTLGVEATADTVEEAHSQAAEAMEAVMDALISNGVEESDIQTQRFTIYPVREWIDSQETLVSYRVTNIVTAKIRNVDDAGLIIDAVAQAGGDLTQVQDIDFTVDDPSPFYSQARAEAMADARAKVEELASLAGVTLGAPIYISESGGLTTPYYWETYMAVPVPGVATPISAGEIEITLNVQVIYAIE